MTNIVTASVSPEFFSLAKEHSISWSEAMRVGISMLLAEKGLRDYDNNLNLYRKMRYFQKGMEDFSQKYIATNEKLLKREGVSIEKKENGSTN